MPVTNLYHTYQRYRTLQTDVISALPIVILMPHSACNCRCVMCDIWKDNKNLKQLTEDDVKGLLGTLRKFGTRQVVMSGGEALLNANFFRLCEILKQENISVVLLSTGLLLEKHAEALLNSVSEIIVSLDGQETHDRIRGIPGAFEKMRNGIVHLKSIRPGFRITSRSVIHRLNFRVWTNIIDAAKSMGIDQVSFLPADVTSQAFNRNTPREAPRQEEVMPTKEELTRLQEITEEIISNYAADFASKYIAEQPEKLRKIPAYYRAQYGMEPFPFKKCNAPWVSTVIEADGTVRPCFFHKSIGNIRDTSLEHILNSPEALAFRKGLDMAKDANCVQCVCYLNLAPGVNKF